MNYLNLETEVLRIPVIQPREESSIELWRDQRTYTQPTPTYVSSGMMCHAHLHTQERFSSLHHPFSEPRTSSSSLSPIMSFSTALCLEYLPAIRRVIEDALSIKIQVVQRTALSTLLPTTILLISTSHHCNCIHLSACPLCKCHTH